MIAANFLETAEQVFYHYLPESLITKVGPCAIGLSATAAGLYLGNLFTDNDSLTELQRHLDKEFYIHEMKSHFLKKEQFSQMQQMTVLSFAISFLFIWIFVLYLFYKLFSLKKLTNQNLTQAVERIRNVEQVIESILKEHEVLDIKQFEFFKTEIEQQRSAFKSFIANRSLEFETTVSDAKTSCLKAKNSVHADLKKITDLMGQVPQLRLNLMTMSSSLEETTGKAANLNQNLEALAAEFDEKLEILKNSTSKTLISIEEGLQNDKIEISKCNSLLHCSEILFEAAISKFEEIELLKSGEESHNDRRILSERMTTCLKQAVELNKFLKSEDLASSKTINGEVEKSKETNINDSSVNILLFDLIKRLELMEEKICSHHSLINGNDVKIRHLESSTSEKISDLKYCSDEWITSWVSVIYGLFNSSFLHIENQLFGIDCLEYTTIFDVANDKVDQSSNLFYEIMDKCKQTCLKIVKEVNLLIFEYYLIQGSIATTSSSLLSLCNTKIDDELEILFMELRQTVERTPMSTAKRTDILNTLVRLKADLTSDLKDDTRKFNTLVKQNLEDFCIIHDTMKTIFKESDKRQTKLDEDSIIEISDHSNSLLSLHEDSSFSENDNSALENLSCETSLRPFKLSVSKQRK